MPLLVHISFNHLNRKHNIVYTWPAVGMVDKHGYGGRQKFIQYLWHLSAVPIDSKHTEAILTCHPYIVLHAYAQLA